MIDWITAIIEVDHKQMDGGSIISMLPNGEREWEVVKRLSVEGSYSSKIQLRTAGTVDGVGKLLWVSGNPCKWFQGHNLCGSDDLRRLVASWLLGIVDKFPKRFRVTERQFAGLLAGDYKLSRVDCTKSLALASRDEVRSWIRAASPLARGRHQKVSAYSDQTLYLGKESRRISLKIYCKGDELQAHPLPKSMPDDEVSRLLGFADTHLRVELCLRGKELKDRGLETGRAWEYDTPNRLLTERINAMHLPENVPVKSDADFEGLPPRLVAVYKLWLQGEDIRGMFPKNTFYRYRTELLKKGIDLSSPPRKAEVSNVVPLWRYLIAEPVGVPEWAKGTPLYFDPAEYLRSKGF